MTTAANDSGGHSDRKSPLLGSLCPGVTFARHVSVTSVEWYCVTLRPYMAEFLCFGMKNDDFPTKIIQIADLNR